jgi:nitrogen-specific signal transduction histidine kinase
VKDTGSGIHPDILPRLFSKFASKSFQGTGLGLFIYIIKNIIEAHGGEENNADHSIMSNNAYNTCNRILTLILLAY